MTKFLVLYSGGMGSFLAASLLKQKGEKDVTLLFTDTRSEDPDLYRFLKETQRYLGYGLITLDQGLNIWDVFYKEKYLVNTRIDPCSRVLKREPTHRFIKENPQYDVVVCGFSYDEQDRLERARKHFSIPLVAPLAEDYIDTRQYADEVLARSGISRPRLYDWGLQHNNCGGFCGKAGLAHYRQLWQSSPETYKMFEEKQEKLHRELPGTRPFLRKTNGGTIRYLTLREYREEWLEPGASDSETEALDTSGCITCSLG